MCCRPIPDREYVESFIKAFYLPEDQLEIFIRDHKVTDIELIDVPNVMKNLTKCIRILKFSKNDVIVLAGIFRASDAVLGFMYGPFK